MSMNHGERYFRLGDMLLHRGTITSKKLQRGLKVSHETQRRLGDVLVDLGYASEEEVTRCLAEQYGFPYEELTLVNPDAAALRKVSPEFALKWCVLPLEDRERFRCVVADPLNVELSDTIAAIARKPVVFSIAGRNVLQTAIRVAYGLPVPKVVAGRKRRPPQPETILQQDRNLLLEAINFEFGVDQHMRRAS
jgi:type IV pilus assembly protein PilB